MERRLFYAVVLYIITLLDIIESKPRKDIYEECIASKANKGELYRHTYQNLTGQEVSLEEYRGHVTLILNVASF